MSIGFNRPQYESDAYKNNSLIEHHYVGSQYIGLLLQLLWQFKNYKITAYDLKLWGDL